MRIDLCVLVGKGRQHTYVPLLLQLSEYVYFITHVQGIYTQQKVMGYNIIVIQLKYLQLR